MHKLIAAALLATCLIPATAMAQEPIRLAFLAASSQNGYNDATWKGVQAAAEKAGNVQVEIFDGEFNAATQYKQVEDIIAGGRFDGIIIAPNDTVGIATALEEATKEGLLVAATLFPVGPELTVMTPQVPGLTTTVASNPVDGAAAQAEEVVKFCADKDPCNVVVMIGQLQFPFDNLRNKTFESVLSQHSNIKIVATGEGNYSPDASLTAFQDIIQANPKIDVVLSNADQHLLGVEIALNDAGIPVEPIYMIGGGLNQITVDKIKSGVFDATLSGYPYSEGYYAADALIRAKKGETVENWIDPATKATNPTIVNKEWLDAHPDFKAEWEG
ncbi:MAG: sugar ABC transporter substrate-binding protein [Devosia sp.]|uniref:sugar ABC transporter substrate-binding protein n=1 Tax=Devosia sp. TaxID=1871048 RepID=UPI001AC17B80|nr:sugar ABC transporter substrate-binding protein [Devosia sp.]MBN9310548.1 sugar ABC transporter substrate-binding protein [Devosia sp.]MBN9316217.1 sugar ABC transporter substrate-binding protein [Devosia sp.]